MLCVLKTQAQVQALEAVSDRLVSRRLAPGLHAVAAEDLGDCLKHTSVAAAAEAGYDGAPAIWSRVQSGMAHQATELSLFGLTPFWFLESPDWPPSAFLAWTGLHAWALAQLGQGPGQGEMPRPLMAAVFSSDQLIVGLADSAEFHDRLSLARSAPVDRPLHPLPFRVHDHAPPQAVRHIDLSFGAHVQLHFEDGAEAERLTLQA